MEQAYRAIKAAKPWVKFGISPFGIWRPKNPPAISGFDSYAELYADSRKWLRAGWCDYFTPQLYWGIAPPPTSFTTLLNWWNGENILHRHIWPGMNSLNVGEKWPPSEIINEIRATRWLHDEGQVHWNISALMNNAALDAALQHDAYQQPALIPASPWLDSTPPDKPKLTVLMEKNFRLAVRWENSGGEPVRLWVLQFRTDGIWMTEILPANETDRLLENLAPDAISIRAVDRTGNLSAPTVLSPQKFPPAQNVRESQILNRPPKK
jgi:hypothetical protein